MKLSAHNQVHMKDSKFQSHESLDSTKSTEVIQQLESGIEELNRKIETVTGTNPHPLTREEGNVAVEMFLKSPEMKKASSKSKKELKNALHNPPPSSQARSKKNGTIEEEAYAAQWEMAVAMQAFHSEHMKKPEECGYFSWSHFRRRA